MNLKKNNQERLKKYKIKKYFLKKKNMRSCEIIWYHAKSHDIIYLPK